MKRMLTLAQGTTIADEPDAKVARVDTEAADSGAVITPAPGPGPREENGETVEGYALDQPWRFITVNEEGALLLYEWDPASAGEKAEKVARALVKSHRASTAPSLHFADTIEWCIGDRKDGRPAEFKELGIAQSEVGTFTRSIVAQLSYCGPTLIFVGWC